MSRFQKGCAVGLTTGMVFLLIALTMWALPVFAETPAAASENSPLLAWAASGLSIASLAGLAATWGRTQQRLTEFDRRFQPLDECNRATPGRLLVMESMLSERKASDDARHAEVLRRFDKLESLQHQHE